VYQFDKNEYPLPNSLAATARTAHSTIHDASAVTAGSPYELDTSVHLSVDRKLDAYKSQRSTIDADFTARMNEIDDRMQRLQDDLDAITEKVTTSVLEGLQNPDGLLTKQNGKIDLLSAKIFSNSFQWWSKFLVLTALGRFLPLPRQAFHRERNPNWTPRHR
jgi:hypothetical protein